MTRIVLDRQSAEFAVYGGAVLGGGGGGWIEDGLRIGRLAIEVGRVELRSIDELADDELLVAVGLVGAPGAAERHVEPVHDPRALDLPRGQLDRPVSGIITNENGATATVNGWFQAAITGLAVVDCPCNGRAHPTGVMGSLNLSEQPNYLSRQVAVGGAGGRYLEASFAGPLERTAAMVRKASVEAGGLMAVARDPVSAAYARLNGTPGAEPSPRRWRWARHCSATAARRPSPPSSACSAARSFAEGEVTACALRRPPAASTSARW